MLTIVMYHYVRDLPRTRHPRIKARLTRDFDGQLDWIARHHTVVPLSAVVAAGRGKDALPPNACVLSFDDGLADHYETVLPRLVERGWSGCFFPCASPVIERDLLDVHKVHFILACSDDPAELARTLLASLGEFRSRYDLPDDAALRREHARPNRFDPADVILIKRLLQTVLPRPVREALTDRIFRRVVSADPRGFADELYLSLGQLRRMRGAGMEIGGHGWGHEWLGNLAADEQAEQIERSKDLLGRIEGGPPADWAFCYPYGSYNAATLELLARAGCAIGLTTEPARAASLDRPLELPRLDTNDLPTRAGAACVSEGLPRRDGGRKGGSLDV